MYLDATSGRTLELYFAQVERTGPLFSLGRVANNQAIGPVRIDHGVVHGFGTVSMGDLLIVGPLDFLPEGPRATAAWRVQVQTNGSLFPHNTPVPTRHDRHFGVITRVNDFGAYGFVSDERTGSTVFVHATQLRMGARLQVGQRVSYVLATNPRGPAAFDVWAA
jgi:cold shock CspA family protein